MDGLYYGLDGAILLEHLLVVGSALEAVPGLHKLAHQFVDLEPSAFFQGEIEKVVVELKKLNIFLLLGVGPTVAFIVASSLHPPPRSLLAGCLDDGLSLFFDFDLNAVFLLLYFAGHSFFHFTTY